MFQKLLLFFFSLEHVGIPACLQLLTGPQCAHAVTVWCPHTPVFPQMDISACPLWLLASEKH